MNPDDPLGELSGERADRVRLAQREGLVQRLISQAYRPSRQLIEAAIDECDATLDDYRGTNAYWFELEGCLEARRIRRGQPEDGPTQ